jgi:hypothetical protein
MHQNFSILPLGLIDVSGDRYREIISCFRRVVNLTKTKIPTEDKSTVIYELEAVIPVATMHCADILYQNLISLSW